MKKYDQNKNRLDLVPVGPIEAVGRVRTYAISKYGQDGVDGWHKIDSAKDRYYAALLRHLFAWRRGEKIDDKESGGSGLPHLEHVLCNAFFLHELENKDK